MNASQPKVPRSQIERALECARLTACGALVGAAASGSLGGESIQIAYGFDLKALSCMVGAGLALAFSIKHVY
nr:hypothetical protein 6 [bacterium]